MDSVAGPSGQGYHAWAYDALDFLAYFAEFVVTTIVGGVALDLASGRLYVSQLKADRVGYDPLPLIQVYQVSAD